MTSQSSTIEQTRKENIMKEVYDSGLQILSPSSKEELYPKISQELFKLIGAKFISIYRANHKELIKEYTTSELLQKVKPGKRGFTYKAFRSSTPYIINYEYLWKKYPDLKGVGIHTTITIPLTFELEPLGVLSVDLGRKAGEEITEEVMHALQLFASFITYKIKNIELQQKLAETVQNQKLFMSLASHELKNPLTAVLGYATLVQRQVNKGKTLRPELLNSLISEINRMSTLIDELLNTRNSEYDRAMLVYNKKPSSMSEIIRSTMSNFSLSYPSRAVVFEDSTKGKNVVNVDPMKMKQVFSNLLVNAAKFSDTKTKIKISLSLSDSHIIIQVTDQGIGISKKDIANIFKRFYKGSKVKREGMGLGLYLTKKIIDNHNGTINAFSKKGKGTTFEIVLPLI